MKIHYDGFDVIYDEFLSVSDLKDVHGNHIRTDQVRDNSFCRKGVSSIIQHLDPTATFLWCTLFVPHFLDIP